MTRFSLEQSVIATVAYFDFFDFPLTAFEIWKHLISDNPVPLKEVCAFLDSSPPPPALELYEGMFVLSGRAALVEFRRLNVPIMRRKFLRARRVTRLLARLVFVRMIAVVNTLGLGYAREGSDIDLLIVASPGHIAIVRFLCTGLLTLCGMRPREAHARDTMCLSFFVTCDGMDLSNLKLPDSGGVGDVYFAQWLSHCTPLYTKGDTYVHCMRENEWARVVLPNAFSRGIHPGLQVRLDPVSGVCKKVIEFLLAPIAPTLERVAFRFQMRILPPELRSLLNTDTRVVMNERVMKFHSNDRREEIRAEWLKRVAQIRV